MKRLYMAFFCCGFALVCFSQAQRIAITSITPSLYTGQDYSPWLNDNIDSLVADAWQDNMQYIDVTLQLQSKTLVSKLTFYDGQGVFTTNPAYIYALKDGEKIYLGKFEGLTYNTFVDLNLQYPILADAIVIHKYSNNIPQKVQIFGQPYIDSATTPEPATRLFYTTPIPSENTGQNYNEWLNDDVDSTIDWGNQNSFKYIDVKLPLQQRSKITKFSFWDTEGTFGDDPCYFYAIKDTQKTYLGSFIGPGYMIWDDLILSQGVTADTILVHKYSRYIPQKINVYGEPLLKDPLDTLIPPDGRIKITAVLPAENTGQDYSSWLSDNLDSLVPNCYAEANFKYTDITLTLASKSKVGRLSFYDYSDIFDTNPAYIYAKNDTTTTFLGTFIGPNYKVFDDLLIPDSIVADAIIIHKYGNNIPEKIKVFGAPFTAPPVIDSTPIVKIPIDPKRWYQLDNVTDGINQMFDGDTNTTIYAGYGKILANYDAYYPLGKNESIDLTGVKFYDGQGALGDFPVTMSVINDQGQKIQVATFNGNQYNAWVGPYPDRQNNTLNFSLDSTIKNVRYIVLNCWYQYPNEIQLFGKYKPGTIDSSAAIAKTVRFKDATGINAFEWDFENPNDPMNIDSASYAGVKNFTAVRHYMDWEKLESEEGSYTYSPVHSGGWNYDTIYQRCKADSITILACLKTIPGWLQATYPDDQKDAENTPVAYGSDFSDPMSYIKQAKMGFQYIARYGSNTAVDPSLLSVNAQPRWNFDQINVVKIGMGVVKYIECDNERDKWWKGRKAYQTSYEYAANLSAFYDGNMNTMGPGVGVKNADSTVKVVMAGLASPDPSYLRGMIEWCRLHRGYKPDGSVNLCWDIINYHLYSNDASSSQSGNATRGAAPEKSESASVARAFRLMAHQEAGDMPVWITELGYDENQGSPLKAIPIGNKSVLQTQADWDLRSALLYVREGVEKTFFYQLYDDNPTSPVQFGSMGFLKPDRSRKPSADYLMQVNKLIGNYTYAETLNSDPLVDRYDLNGNPAYVLMIPDEVGRTGTYSLELDNVDSVKICTPLAGSDTMQTQYAAVVNGKIDINVTETPVFVLPLAATSNLSHAMKQQTSMEETTTINNVVELAKKLNVYPNPASNTVTVTVAANNQFNTQINIIDIATGRICMHVQTTQGDGSIVKNIDLSNLAAGMYKLQIVQGNNIQYRSLIKTGN